MDVSIIIVNYNTKELTSKCIESIFQNTKGLSFEIILVDNQSTDGSKELFEYDSRLVYIYKNSNDGFGCANNIGLKKAVGKYIFFLNSDTILLNNAIKVFWNIMQENSIQKRIGALGCLLIDKAGGITHSYAKIVSGWKYLLQCAILPVSNKYAKKIIGLDKAVNIHKDLFKVGYVTGADLMVPRRVLEECGAFDPDFFMYFEEVEMQYRFHNYGYNSMILKDTHIVHLVGASQKRNTKSNIRNMLMKTKSLFIYSRKTMSIFNYTLFRLSYIIINIPFFLFSRHTSWADRKEYFKFIILA